jgi:hypothetical protein
VVELRYNNLDPKSATMLATVAKEKRISLCGVTPEQTEADFSSYKTGSYMWPADAVHIAADLTVRPSLTSIDLSENVIRSEGAKALAPALRDNTSITVVDLRYNQLDSESATILANIAREKNISVCGIKPDPFPIPTGFRCHRSHLCIGPLRHYSFRFSLGPLPLLPLLALALRHCFLLLPSPPLLPLPPDRVT